MIVTPRTADNDRGNDEPAVVDKPEESEMTNGKENNVDT